MGKGPDLTYSVQPHLRDRFDCVGKSLRFAGQEAGDVAAWRGKARRKLKALIGLDAMASCALQPRVTERLDCGDHVRERVVLEVDTPDDITEALNDPPVALWAIGRLRSVTADVAQVGVVYPLLLGDRVQCLESGHRGARQVADLDLGQGESASRGEDGNVPVEFAIDANLAEDFLPVRLERAVEIMQRDMRQSTDDSVEDSRGQ